MTHCHRDGAAKNPTPKCLAFRERFNPIEGISFHHHQTLPETNSKFAPEFPGFPSAPENRKPSSSNPPFFRWPWLLVLRDSIPSSHNHCSVENGCIFNMIVSFHLGEGHFPLRLWEKGYPLFKALRSSISEKIQKRIGLAGARLIHAAL